MFRGYSKKQQRVVLQKLLPVENADGTGQFLRNAIQLYGKEGKNENVTLLQSWESSSWLSQGHAME